jgi:cysteine-rich repeat protein
MQRTITLIISSFSLVACGAHDGPGEPRTGICGDGLVQVEAGEECDDGNSEADDGCSRICMLEDEAGSCGDGWLIPGEECDDGNDVSGDGCSPQCTVEGDHVCLPGGQPCVPDDCVAGDTDCGTCGDGVLQQDEQCDDGNAAGADGCSSECLPEAGFGCFVPGQPCVPTIPLD